MIQNRVPCFHCRGLGFEPTAIEIFDTGLAATLRNLMWPEPRITRLREELRADEALANMPRWGGLDLIDSQGNRRTLERMR